ncbi:MAG TPA: cyclic nucleotide-binding domain-containing protein [Gammaproteobacteria bacterium]|nr:cyclic nucleotide-binding domain-containing protein [Gammaproteobacteria bacterium]
MPKPAIAPLIDIADLKVSCSKCSLSALCLPYGLNREELDHLEQTLIHKPTLRANEALYFAGDDYRGLCAVRSGSFKTVLTTPDGAEQITGFYLPGELLGLDGLGQDKYRCSAIALETASVCEIRKEEFKTICSRIPNLQEQILRLMGNNFSQDQERLLSMGQLKGEERIATFLISMGQRLRARGFSSTRFNLTMSRHDLANYLGLAVETLSRMLSHLQERKLIAVNRRSIEILEEERIRKLAHLECRHG